MQDEGRSVRSIFQPTFGFKGCLERSARTRFRGCRFGSLSQSLVSQLPVRLITINRGQGEHEGHRRVSIDNTLTAEVSFNFVIPKGHSAVRLSSFVERCSVLRQNVDPSELLLNLLDAPCAERVSRAHPRSRHGCPSVFAGRHDRNRDSRRATIESVELLLKYPRQIRARNSGFRHVSPRGSDDGAKRPSFVERTA